MKKRIGFIGLSYPIMYDPDRSAKAWLGGPPLPPHPILDSPYGLIVLYDELWFLDKELCPLNMRGLPFVKYVSEAFTNIDYSELYKKLENAKIDMPSCRYKNIDEIKRGLNIVGNPHFSRFTQTSYISLGNRVYEASPTLKNYIFDILIWRELQKQTRNDIEVVANSNIPFENIVIPNKDINLTNKLIINGIPNYVERYGPYHPCISELRESPYLKDFRKWILENHEHIQSAEIEEMQEAVEAEIARIEREVFLKCLKDSSWSAFGVSTAKTILDTVIDLTPAGGIYGIGTAVGDVIMSGKEASATQKYRWSGFVEMSRISLQNAKGDYRYSY